MSKLQRLTPKRVERLKGAVIKDIITEEEIDSRYREKYTRIVEIELEDGRSLLFNAVEIEGDVIAEMFILPKKKRRR